MILADYENMHDFLFLKLHIQGMYTNTLLVPLFPDTQITLIAKGRYSSSGKEKCFVLAATITPSAKLLD